jgi:hypothetical protein
MESYDGSVAKQRSFAFCHSLSFFNEKEAKASMLV